jgi:outer membrane cobalamin receptor
LRSRLLFFVLLLSSATFAADLRLKVTDPNGGLVRGARVVVYRGTSVVALQNTMADGSANFSNITDGEYRVEILAPGFAPARLDVTLPVAAITAKLAVAAQPETVNVTAAGSPLEQQYSASQVETLNGGQLELMQPTEAAEALRFVPGAVVNAAGREGGQASLFVRGGESRYNKVLVDGVPIDDPGGEFDFGVVPMYQVDRLEVFRGPQSVLYGSDAMTSVVQMFSATGSTTTPLLRFGADGGTFSSARGYASLAGAWRWLDYNLFADQANTEGQGVNDAYSNSEQGANLGFALGEHALFRLRTRHSNSRSGVQSAWDYNDQELLAPDSDQRARQNNFLASGELTVQAPARFIHKFTAYEYDHHRLNVDSFFDLGRAAAFDFPFQAFANLNRAGFDYQGEYQPAENFRATFGYEFEDEHGAIGELLGASVSNGLRRNHAAYLETMYLWKRVSLTEGFRYVHNENFGDRVVPRVALSLLALRGGDRFSGTRLRFVYSQGIKEPRFEETFGQGGGFPILPNLNLKPEESQSFEAGVEQSLDGGRYAVTATYFHNIFLNEIDFALDPCFCQGQYVNVNRELAHGAELEFHGRITSKLGATASYTYLSSQVLAAPFAFDPLLAPGQPLLRRPKHSGSLLLTYVTTKWGAQLGGTFVGRRPDSDFLGFGIDHAAGYARFDTGAWYALNRHVTAYANVDNFTDRDYEEVVGYPGLKANFRAGLRFAIGGE